MENKKMFFIGVTALLLSGCESVRIFDGAYGQTEFKTAEIEKEGKIEYVPVPIPVSKPYLKKLPEIDGKMILANKITPEQAIEDARKAALQKSTPGGFINAMQVFDYMPGALYEIYASQGYITSIILKPGERLIAKTAGDTVRWIVGETTMGSGSEESTVLVLKPVKSDLSTNMMITTDQRIYVLEVRSIDGGVYNASVSWNYPHDDFKDLATSAKRHAAREEQVIAGNVNIHDLNYDYSIENVQGSKPKWYPVEAFDDGRKTYIRFSNDLGTTRAPVLYVLSSDGDTEIVNYRVRGNFYVIDRLVDAVELRMGTKSQQIVRITRHKSGSVFGGFFKSPGSRSSGGYNG